jgi:hypothetical protein
MWSNTSACTTERRLNDNKTDLFALRRVDGSREIRFPVFVSRMHGLDAGFKVVRGFLRTPRKEAGQST